MPNQTINQLLRKRKQKSKQLASYRKGRVVKAYRKAKEQEEKKEEANANSEQLDEGQQRQLKFYKEVFNGKQPVPQKKKSKVKVEEQRQDPETERLQRLKNKKKRFIKKMQYQKTNKGQPLMRNYIKYALTKLEETMQKEKIGQRGKK